MFTGLVQRTSTVRKVESMKKGDRIWVDRPSDWTDIEIGESISVSGVCLTVTEKKKDRLAFDRCPETLERSRLYPQVNLERCLRLKDLLGGHLVYGHVDGLLEITNIKKYGDFQDWTFKLPTKSYAPFVVEKGSVSIEGVSLTIAKVLSKKKFTVSLIPHTIVHTNFKNLNEGDFVNFEIDMFAKYVAKQIGAFHHA